MFLRGANMYTKLALTIPTEGLSFAITHNRIKIDDDIAFIWCLRTDTGVVVEMGR